MQSFLPLAAVLAGYLIGSLSFAVIVSRVMGLNDPRTFGSKNPGATNVLRSGSKGAAIATLLLDAAKGWLAVMLVQWFGKPYGLAEGTMAMVGLAAFVGHLYPVFFRFVGGKGVATALGVLLGISWILGLAIGVTWLIMAYLFRISSLASLTTAVLAPVYYILGDGGAWYLNKGVLLSLSIISLLLIYRHAENIGRLAKGTESRLGKKIKPEPHSHHQDHAHKNPHDHTHKHKH
jgi:glycerol-3-phosphate acyltransferase PlsY